MIPRANSGKQPQNQIDEIVKGPLEYWVVECLEEMWNGIESDASKDPDILLSQLRLQHQPRLLPYMRDLSLRVAPQH